AATGRSRTRSVTPPLLYWFRPLGLLFWPRLLPRRLVLGIAVSPWGCFALHSVQRTRARPVAPRRGGTVRSCPESASDAIAAQAVSSWSSICSALDARYSPGASTLSCSTTPSLTSIE